MHFTYIDNSRSKFGPKCLTLITYISKIHLFNYTMKLKFCITGKMHKNLPKKEYTGAHQNDDQISHISQKSNYSPTLPKLILKLS